VGGERKILFLKVKGPKVSKAQHIRLPIEKTSRTLTVVWSLRTKKVCDPAVSKPDNPFKREKSHKNRASGYGQRMGGAV